MKRSIFALILLATPAFAEAPAWTGIWTADPDWCQYTDLIGEHDPAPIRFTETKLTGLETRCTIDAVRGNAQYQYWELTLSCSGEGEHYQDSALLMLDGHDAMWRWFGGGAPYKFTRCGN